MKGYLRKFVSVEKLLLLLLFALAFWLRTYRLHYPLADWHSWRQADTAAVSRNFIKDGFTPLYPKFDSLWALNSYGKKNIHRYFFAEFPLYNILTYPFYHFFGVNVAYARLVTIFFSSLTVISLYLLVRLYSGRWIAALAAFLFAVMPYNVYWGRVVMPDALHIFCGVSALFLLSIWRFNNKWWPLLGGGALLALAILTKPYGIVLGTAVLGILALQSWPQLWRNRRQIIVMGIISLAPYLLWRWHINHYPEGQFGTDWLVNSTHIRFRPAFFRWLIYERLIKIMLGGAGIAFFAAGLMAPKKKEEWIFYFSWLAGLLVFVSYFATGNVTHDYYQLPLVPLVAIFAAKGMAMFYGLAKNFWQRAFNLAMILTLLAIMLAMGWYETKGYWNVNNWAIVKAGRAADRLLPADAKVIAPYNNDSAFLYQTNRIGWPSVPEDINKMIADGAGYYVSVNFDNLTRKLMDDCRIVARDKDWIIVNLHQCRKIK